MSSIYLDFDLMMIPYSQNHFKVLPTIAFIPLSSLKSAW